MAVMAAVVAGLGLVLYDQFRAELNRTIDGGLSARASTLSALARQPGDQGAAAGLRRDLARQGESFAQIIGATGRALLDAAPGVSGHSLLRPAELRRATRSRLRVEHDPFPGARSGARLLAVPVRVGATRVVAVVGTSVHSREDALFDLRTLLLLGGPVALLFASLAGYGVASGALRPVEFMRRRAAAISAQAPGQRLPVPPANDEVSRLGRTLNAMLTRLEAALEHERSFTANASHELRTPLAILKTELELATGKTRTVEELEAVIDSATEETERLERLAEDLLVIARADQGKLPLRLSPVNVGELLANVGRRFASRAHEQARTIDIEAGNQLVIRADSLRLEQAVGNMVDNALRHGAGNITLRVEEHNSRVELHVGDHGCGFPMGFLPEAFQRFTRAEPGRTRAGTGLGLAIVDSIARSHGGSAQATSRAEGGADVWISLPTGMVTPPP